MYRYFNEYESEGFSTEELNIMNAELERALLARFPNGWNNLYSSEQDRLASEISGEHEKAARNAKYSGAPQYVTAEENPGTPEVQAIQRKMAQREGIRAIGNILRKARA
jgi:hypothetical protein